MTATGTKAPVTDDRDEVQRRAYGPRAVGALLPAITRPAFRKRSPAAAQLMADWGNIVGPALAAVTVPRRLTGGRLAIACAGPVAMELQHLAPELIARINTHVGQALVAELRFTQDHTARPESHPTIPARVPPQVAKAVDNQLADLADGPLRDALAALGRSIHSNHPNPHGRRGRNLSTSPKGTG